MYKLVQKIILLHVGWSLAQDDFYIGAVVEYNSFWSSEINPEGNFFINALKTVNFMETVDIIVFPEIGLLKYDSTIFIEIPDPIKKIAPADSNSYHPVLKKISEAARTYRIYTVINVHEVYKNKKFNTNVVFDRSGTIIARYRKFNLFNENLNAPESPTFIYFDTDFGTRFGTFTCFDILFKEPAYGLVHDYNITDIIFPTAWGHELPFLTAIQVQSSWAYSNDVNLLAANHNDLSVGGSGSGLYRGLSGKPLAIQTIREGSTLMIGKMKKQKGSYDDTISSEDVLIREHKNVVKPWIQKEPVLDKYQTALISPDVSLIIKKEKIVSPSYGSGYKILYQINKTICHSELCCHFDITYTNIYYYNIAKDDISFKNLDAFYHYNYRMAVFDGIRFYIVGDKKTGQQICSIIPCLSKKLETCGLVTGMETEPEFVQIDNELFVLYSTSFNYSKISGIFSKGDKLVLPDILHSNANQTSKAFGTVSEPKQFDLQIDNNKVSLVFNSERLITGGIYVRLFERDYNSPNSSLLNIYSYPCLYILMVFFIRILF